MANVTLQDLLESGISLDEVLFNKEPVNVNVEVNTDALLEMLKKNQATNTALINGMQDVISRNNKEHKEFLVKAISFLIKSEKEKSKIGIPEKPITGLNVIRDGNDRISKLEFIRK